MQFTLPEYTKIKDIIVSVKKLVFSEPETFSLVQLTRFKRTEVQ